MLRTAALATLCASAAAFTSPAVFSNAGSKARTGLSLRMSAEDVSRRGVIEGATVFGAAALVAPQFADAKVENKQAKDFLAPATYNKYYQGKAPNTAPVVVVHDERGCLRPRNEYTGAKSGTEDDEMCVQVKSKTIAANTRLAEEILSEFKTWSGIVSQKK